MHLMREAIKGTGASSESAEAHEHLLLWLETISLTPPGSDQGSDSAVKGARYSAALSEVDSAASSYGGCSAWEGDSQDSVDSRDGSACVYDDSARPRDKQRQGSTTTESRI